MANFSVSLKTRLKQFLCNHKKRSGGWSAYSEGMNSKEGNVYLVYECRGCGMTQGKWYDSKEVDIDYLFSKEVHKI